MKAILMISSLIVFTATSLISQPKPALHSGPNCHNVNAAKSVDGGKSYKQIAKNVLKSASVPDAVHFRGKDFIYYVNGSGGYNKHSIFVSQLRNGGKSSKLIGPVKIDGKIIRDAVDPDLILMPNGKLRLFYYVGYFTSPMQNSKRNKIYSAISTDGINFKSEGAMVALDDPTDPSVTKIPNGNYLLAVPQGKKQKITIYSSSTGYNFKKIKTIKGGIPELSIGSNGQVQLLYQDKDLILKESTNGGKSWKTKSKKLVSGAPPGSNSPSVLLTSDKNRIMYYAWGKKGCTTSPTEFLKDKNAFIGNGSNNSAMGEPPLGHGVKPKDKKKN